MLGISWAKGLEPSAGSPWTFPSPPSSNGPPGLGWMPILPTPTTAAGPTGAVAGAALGNRLA